MYAIIETGGKQYRVEEGDIIEVELLKEAQEAVEFDRVLFFSDGKTPQLGTPHVTKCLVKGEVIGEARGPKVVSFIYKRRKNYRRKVGHRQKYSRVKITTIQCK
ncbi:MAG: 50S ribosomal protein L21 [Chlamydiota bacterium]